MWRGLVIILNDLPEHVAEEAGVEGVSGNVPWQLCSECYRHDRQTVAETHETLVELHHASAIRHPSFCKPYNKHKTIQDGRFSPAKEVYMSDIC